MLPSFNHSEKKFPTLNCKTNLAVTILINLSSMEKHKNTLKIISGTLSTKAGEERGSVTLSKDSYLLGLQELHFNFLFSMEQHIHTLSKD